MKENKNKIVPKEVKLAPKQTVVEIKAVTWSKDSHGLFDYENSYYDMKKFQQQKSVIFYRSKKDIIAKDKDLSHEISKEDNPEFLMSISINPDKRKLVDRYKINIPGEFPLEGRSKRQTFLIVRSLKKADGRSQRGYNLQPGDVVKLGRI